MTNLYFLETLKSVLASSINHYVRFSIYAITKISLKLINTNNYGEETEGKLKPYI